MPKRVCIHQPDFLPYLGFFDRLLDCDVFLIHDDVQFNKRGWHHRDKIKCSTGTEWLTTPVQASSSKTLINEICLVQPSVPWCQKHWRKIKQNYQRAVKFGDVSDRLETSYLNGGTKLVDFNMGLLREVLDILRIDIEIILTSDLCCTGSKNEKIVNLIQAVDGTHYLSGTGALCYLKPESYRAANIQLEVQVFDHPIYPQLYGPFVANLSILDLLLNCGNGSSDTIRGSRRGKLAY